MPNSVDEIYREGYKEKVIDYMALIKRDGQVIWDDKDKQNPGVVYSNYLNNYNYSDEVKNDSIISLNNSKREISILEDEYIYNIIIPYNFAEKTNKVK